MTDKGLQFVDPVVTRSKFEREVALYKAQESTYQKRGWWLMRAEFPTLMVAFISMKTQPRVVMFGALLDFTNYDVWPPSVSIVDPFTEERIEARALPTRLARRVTNPSEAQGHLQMGNQVIPVSFLIQAWDNGGTPFVCLPGVREYHENPGHSGDSWLLHRRGGEGSLYFILEKLWRYGSDAVQTLGVNLIPQITFPTSVPE